MRVNKRKFVSYQGLLMALKRDGIEEPGKTATLLLELFLEDNGRMYAQKVINAGLCEDGKFKIWRDKLIKMEWISFDIECNRKNNDFTKHNPSRKLISYINREKLLTKEIVTKDDILMKDEVLSKEEFHELKEEFDGLKDKVSKIEASMREIYGKLNLGEIDPPDFEKLKGKTSTVEVIFH